MLHHRHTYYTQADGPYDSTAEETPKHHGWSP